MQYQIDHTTTYTYSQPVALQPHTLRLQPRSDGTQQLQAFSLAVTPTPMQQSQVIDLDGNAIVKLWFAPDPTDSLQIQVRSQVETCRTNPFDYLLEPWALRLPIDYPTSLWMQLQPYLNGQQCRYPVGLDPIAVELAQEINQQVDADPTQFLITLNQRIYESCQHLIRETGDPLPPGITWSQKQGSCRDLTVLFIEVCRAIGLAARFVSGYQEGDLKGEDFHLHAWAEVYLPGAGWRGYDPTQGLAVADRHVALVASAVSNYAAPVSGSFNRAKHAQASISYRLMISAPSDKAEPTEGMG